MANVVSRASKGGNEDKPAGRLSGRRSERPEDGRVTAPARRGGRDGEREAAAASAKSATARASRAKGRPVEVEDSVPVTVRLPAELVRQLDAMVEESGFEYRDRSELIRHTLARLVNRREAWNRPYDVVIPADKVRRVKGTPAFRFKVDEDGNVNPADVDPVALLAALVAAAGSKGA